MAAVKFFQTFRLTTSSALQAENLFLGEEQWTNFL